MYLPCIFLEQRLDQEDKVVVRRFQLPLKMLVILFGNCIWYSRINHNLIDGTQNYFSKQSIRIAKSKNELKC